MVSTFRENATGRDFNAARVDGWLLWDDDGRATYVEAPEFEHDYTKAPAADQGQ